MKKGSVKGEPASGRLPSEKIPKKILGVSWRRVLRLTEAIKGKLHTAYLLWRCRIKLWVCGEKFDAVWYLKQNPDVAESGLPPFHHYAYAGRVEGRMPGPDPEDSGFAEEESGGRWPGPLKNVGEGIRVAVSVHCFYPELWPQIEEKLLALRTSFDLFITAPHEKASLVRAQVTKTFPQARFFFVPNRGMDIAPFLSLVPTLIQEKYSAVCKLHTKKGGSGIPEGGRVWRQIMLETLIGSDANFFQAAKAFAEDPEVCMIGPAALFQSGPRLMYRNRPNLEKILATTYKQLLPKTDWGFFAGTMFWIRPTELKALAQFSDPGFYTTPEGMKGDGELEHALERFFGLLPLYSPAKKVGLLHLKSFHPKEGCLSFVDSFASAGKASTTNILRQFARLEKDEAIIRASQLFDERYYIEQCEAYLHPGMDLVTHYLLHGTYQGVWPNRYFCPKEYRQLHPDVVKRDEEPFVDYLTRGARARLRFRRRKKDEQDLSPHYPCAVLGREIVPWQEVSSLPRDPKLVSIVILAFGEGELTRDCIRSILGSEVHASYEIILVDNGSIGQDRSLLKECAEENPRIHRVVNPENYHFALGCNIGFSKSRGGTVVFLNNDTLVTPGWLDRLIAPLKDPKIAAVQPRLLYPDGTVQNVGMVFSTWTSVPYPIYGGLKNGLPCLDQSRSYQALIAACLAVRAEDFASMRGFDPVFVDGHEDIDLCLRLTQGTDRFCWYEAGAVVYHHEGKTPGRGRHIAHNRREFILRWAGKIRADDLDLYRQDGFEVAGWTADSSEYLQEGIAMIRPSLVPAGGELVSVVAPPFRMWNGSSSENELPPKDSAVSGFRAFKPGAMSVLVCGHAAGRELFGAERSFLDILEALSVLDLNVIVTFPSLKNGAYLEAVKKWAHRIYIFETRLWTRGVPVDQAVVARFESILAFHRIALAHVNTIMLREPLIAARRSGVVSLVHVREILPEDQDLTLRVGLKPAEVIGTVRSSADFLAANSLETARSLGEGPEVFIVPNVVRADALDIPNIVEPQAIVFGLISSNLRKKGIFDFVDVARLCETSVPNAVFALIGPEEGRDIERLRKQYEGEGLPGNIRFLGYKDSPLASVSLVNVVLSLSLFAESFGRSVAEAFAARRPVIAYEGGALGELVKEGISGYLVRRRDIAAVAAKVEAFCKNPVSIGVFGSAGRESIRAYSVENLSKKLKLVYGEMMRLRGEKRVGSF